MYRSTDFYIWTEFLTGDAHNIRRRIVFEVLSVVQTLHHVTNRETEMAEQHCSVHSLFDYMERTMQRKRTKEMDGQHRVTKGMPRIVHCGPREGPKADSGVRLRGGAATPYSPARGLGERCELPPARFGVYPEHPNVFHYFQYSG